MALTISGLSGSGLDVNEIVKSLMETERVPYTNLTEKKSLLQDQQSVFRTINTKLTLLNTAASELKYSFSLQAYKATSSSDKVTATANDEAITGTYRIVVDQVGKNATAQTTGEDLVAAAKSGQLKIGSGSNAINFSDTRVRSAIGLDGDANTETLLKNITNYVNSNSKNAGTTMSILKNGNNFTVDFTGNDSSSIDIEGLSNTLKVDKNKIVEAFKANDLNIDGINFSNAAVREEILKVNDTEVDINDISDENLLKNIASYINNQQSGTFSVAITDSNFALVNKNSSNVNITSNLIFESDKKTGEFDSQVGQNAKFKINGNSFEKTSNVISDVIPGVTLDLSNAEVSTTPITITVGMDNDKVADKIQSFVDAYNDLIKSIKTATAKPDDVTTTTNPLQSDTVLREINTRLYEVFNQYVSGYGFMEDIGLSIDKGVTSPGSMTKLITFDRDVFTKAASENPTKVTSIVNNITNTMSDTIYNNWTASYQGAMATRIAGYDSDISRIDERLEAMDRSLQMKEARYKQQFNAMEIMLASLNNTQSWLTSQFDTLTSKK